MLDPVCDFDQRGDDARPLSIDLRIERADVSVKDDSRTVTAESREEPIVNIYEQVVELYLTQIEGCAVMPQLRIERLPCGLSWKARPDFVAIDFKAGEVQIVEVTKRAAYTSADRATVDRLASKLDPPHRGSVEAAVQEIALANRLRDWPIRWRFFVRESFGALLAKHPECAAYAFERERPPEIITLEHVFAMIGKALR
jgi:hypothetical protein